MFQQKTIEFINIYCWFKKIIINYIMCKIWLYQINNSYYDTQLFIENVGKNTVLYHRHK